MCEVYKVVHDIGPAYLKKYFTIKNSFYETRTVKPLVLPTFRSVRYGKRSFSYKGTLLWNNLEKCVYIKQVCKGVYVPNFKIGCIWTSVSVSDLCFMYLEYIIIASL